MLCAGLSFEQLNPGSLPERSTFHPLFAEPSFDVLAFLAQAGLVLWWALDWAALVFAWDFLQALETSLFSASAVHFYFRQKKQRWYFEADQLVPFWRRHLLGRVCLFSFRKSLSRPARWFAQTLVAALGKKYLSKSERRRLEQKTRQKEDEAGAEARHGEDFREKVRTQFRLRRRAGLKEFLQTVFIFFVRRHFERYRYLREEFLVYFTLWAKKEDSEALRREAEAEAERPSGRSEREELFWNGLKRIHFLLRRVDRPSGGLTRRQAGGLLADQQRPHRPGRVPQARRLHQPPRAQAHRAPAHPRPQNLVFLCARGALHAGAALRALLRGLLQHARLRPQRARRLLRGLCARRRTLFGAQASVA